MSFSCTFALSGINPLIYNVNNECKESAKLSAK